MVAPMNIARVFTYFRQVAGHHSVGGILAESLQIIDKSLHRLCRLVQGLALL